jgi:hypothetical protein
VRKSVPASNKWVAQLWRSVCNLDWKSCSLLESDRVFTQTTYNITRGSRPSSFEKVLVGPSEPRSASRVC